MPSLIVPGEHVTELPLTRAKAVSENVEAKAAKTALELRCGVVPAECSEEVRGWLKI